MPGIRAQLLLEMRQLSTRVLQERCRRHEVERGKDVHVERREVERDRRSVRPQEQRPVRHQERHSSSKTEPESQSCRSVGRKKAWMAMVASLERLVFAEIGDGQPQGIHRDHVVRHLVFDDEDEVRDEALATLRPFDRAP